VIGNSRISLPSLFQTEQNQHRFGQPLDVITAPFLTYSPGTKSPPRSPVAGPPTLTGATFDHSFANRSAFGISSVVAVHGIVSILLFPNLVLKIIIVLMDTKDRTKAELASELKAAHETIERLESEVATLKLALAASGKNSSNSSKPPSSDIVKPPKPKPKGRRKRKIGAQKGHKQHKRKPFDEGDLDKIVELTLDTCPKCSGNLHTIDGSMKKFQQVDWVGRGIIIVEYRYYHFCCEDCHRKPRTKVPVEIKRAGLFSSNLIATTAYLKGRCHLSYTTLQSLFADAFRVNVSTGFLTAQIRKASNALKPAYDDLSKRLPNEKHVHSDETGWKENGERRWIWCFRTQQFVVFHISHSRGCMVLEELLGLDFSGIISSDYFSAYQKFLRLSEATGQFCWSHVVREVRWFAEQDDKKTSRWGTRLLEAIRKMFKTLHRQDEYKSYDTWLLKMRACQKAILKATRNRVPENSRSQALSARLRDQEDRYFGFIDTGIPPTNNLCEQSIRHVVIDRKITQGTRSDWGNRWNERIWSVLATCALQGRKVMDFLKNSVAAFMVRSTEPPLLCNA
jgi:transposase